MTFGSYIYGRTLTELESGLEMSRFGVMKHLRVLEEARRFGYGGDVDYDLRPGGRFRALASEDMRSHGAPEVVADGEVELADPPRRLVQSWRMLMDPTMAAEGFSRLIYEIEPGQAGITRLTLTHELPEAPLTANLLSGGLETEGGGGGWSWVLSGLKTLLETGQSLAWQG